MKKKISNYSRKALSVFMAVLMVFSMFVLAPEMFTKAEAATAGSYDIRITYSQTGSVSGSYSGTIGTEYNDSCGVTVKYKKNNGTGEEAQTYFNCSSSSGSPTATIPGFPTLIYLYYDENRVAGTKYAHLTKLEVKGTSQTTWTTLWSGDIQVGSVYNPYAISVDSSGTVKKDYFGNDSDCKAISNSGSWTSMFPYASTMTASYANSSLTCPKPGASSVTNTLTFGATDQYGVTMASSLCSVTVKGSQSGTTGISTTSNGTGTDTTTVTSSANIAGTTNSQTVTATCSWSGSSTKTKTATFTLNDCSLTATFTYKNAGLNTAGTTSSTTATAKYGCSPTAPVTPGTYYTTTDHYTFNGWTNSGTLYTSLPAMTSDMTFEAAYTVEAHKFDTYENVSGTNTHTKTCSCGYSVTEDCNWDNGVQIIAPTCVENGTTKYTCVNCGNTRTEQDIATIAHSYTGEIKSNGNGTHSYMCVNGCNQYGGTVSCTYTSEVTTPPTCTTAGVTTYTCTACGYSYTEDLPEATGHSYDDGVQTKAPNCVETGVKTFTCSKCGDTYTEDIPIDSGVHKTLVELPAKEATCTETGLTQGWKCEACGVVTEPQKTVAMVAHKTVKTAALEPTCLAPGNYEYYTCSVCNQVFEDKDATTVTTVADRTRAQLSHSYTGDYKYNATTKTHTRQCVNGCMQYGGEEACSFDSGVVTKAPTCTSAGITTYTCTKCQGTYTTDAPAASGHQWNAGEVMVAATCQNEGVMKYTCTVAGCGAEKTEAIEQLSHSYTGAYLFDEETKTHKQLCVNGCNQYGEAVACTFTSEVTKAPSCTDKGVRTYTCSVCQGTYTEEISATGHTMVKTEAKESTCVVNGNNEYYTCTVCDKVYRDIDGKYLTTVEAETLAKLDHSYTGAYLFDEETKTHKQLCVNGCDEYGEAVACTFTSEITKDPTCTEKGTRKYECSLCHGTYTEEISATGHTMVKTEAKESTCVTNGNNEYYTCAVCHKVYKDEAGVTETTVEGETLAKLEHSYTGAIRNNNDGTHSYMCVNGCNEYGGTVSCAYTSSLTKDATCTEDGLTTYTCTECNYSYTDNTPAAKGHNWGEWTVVISPTCISIGSEKRVCANDESHVETRDINKKEHSYTGDYLFDEATKTHKQLCVNGCNEYGNEEACTFDDGVVTKTPNCTDEGVKTYTCSVCHGTYTEAISANGHTMVKTEAKPSTCVVNGNNEYYTCTICGKIYKDIDGVYETTVALETLPLKDHSYTGAYLFDEETKTHRQLCVNGCNEYGEAVDCTFTSEVTKAPSCTEKGERTYTCVFCGGQYVAEESANGHTMVKTEAKVSTCVTNGNNEYYTCTVCDKVYKDEAGVTETTVEAETLAKLEHSYTGAYLFDEETKTHKQLCVNGCNEYGNEEACTFDDGVVTKTPNCTDEGERTYTCSVCHGTYTETISANGHTMVKTEAKESTCIVNGNNEYYTCTVCDKVYRDVDGVYETTVALETLPLKDHSYTGAYLFDEATKTHKQLCVNGCNEYGEAVDCTFTSEVTKDPSCAEKGERTYTCVFCGGQYMTEIPALGHSMVKTEATAPSCYFFGNNEYYTCSVCGKVYKDEAGVTETTVEAETLPKLPHDNVLIEKVETTCATEGYEKYECKLCGAITCIHDDSPKPDHTFVATDIPATCTTKGGTHFECSVCHLQYDVLDGDYAEHTWAKDWTVDTPATCTQNGSKSIRCTVCGAQGNTAVILKLPHSIDMSTPVNAGAGDNYTWFTFKCHTCDYSVAQFTIFAKDENGNAIPGAKITITDSKGEVEKSGNADENGRFCTENTLFKNGNYTVTITADDNHKTDGVLTVSLDGSVSGSIGHISKSVCGHLCHKDNFIGRLIRSICTFFSAKFNRTIKCCDDMEWYGKYAEGLK